MIVVVGELSSALPAAMAMVDRWTVDGGRWTVAGGDGEW